MENETNGAAAGDNSQTTQPATDTGTDTGNNGQTQAETGKDAPAQDAASNNNAESNATDEAVDYDTLVPKISIDRDPKTVPDPVKDPAAYAEMLKDDLREESKFRNTEVRSWQTLEKEFPEIRTNADLRENILARRIYNAQNGIKGDLLSAGRQVLQPNNDARAEGKADAQVGIEIQERAGTNRATQPRSDQGQSDLLTQYRRGDQTAGQKMVEKMLDDGKI